MKNVILFAGILVVGGCALPDTKKAPEDFRNVKGWWYMDSADRMSTEVWHWAIEHAKSKVFLGPLSNDSVTVSMDLYYTGGSTYMHFKLFKRRFDVDKQYMQPIRLRFDNDKPITVQFGEAEGGGKHIIVSANAVDALVGRMKTAKTMLAELTFDDHVKRIAEFDLSGLKWPYLPEPNPSKK